jgi:hypothetical protein
MKEPAKIYKDSFHRRSLARKCGITIRYIGPVDVPGKNALFLRARALLHQF